MFQKLFFPSFIYSISWEDFDVDKEYMKYTKDDTVLTLTGGGCNALNITSLGSTVYSVDKNPAQNHLLDLKKACASVDYTTLWNAFGKGNKCDFEKVNEFLRPESKTYWESRMHYFKDSIYTCGGMGILVKILRKFNWYFPTLESQSKFKNTLLKNSILNFIASVFKFFQLHYLFFWYLQGVPKKQINLIYKDNRTIESYIHDTLSVFDHIKIEDNPYYYPCLYGNYKKYICPDFLKESNFNNLKENINNLHIIDGSFNDALKERKYTKCVIMDHLDWVTEKEQLELTQLLSNHTEQLLLRSSSYEPPYIEMLRNEGFSMTCLNSHAVNTVCDNVNMYASTWIGVKCKVDYC